jgi:Mlc titration factor MtfA (ptsG expression regulator)
MPGYSWYIFVMAALLLIGFVVREYRIRRGVQRIKTLTFPTEWLPYLEKNVPLYLQMPMELREDFQVKTMMFLEHKKFVPCGGLELTDEIRVTIAGNAALLLLNRPTQVQPFKRVLSVLVYPTTFFNSRDEEADLMSGEAWPTGSVVLAWDAVRKTAHDLRDGKNLVLHEFAHQLDIENGGDANGQPFLDDIQLGTWARVMSKEFAAFQARLARGKPTAMDQYGSSDPAEFFAVATEAFFERPGRLFRDHPDLYEQLRMFYKVDPNRWHARERLAA